MITREKMQELKNLRKTNRVCGFAGVGVYDSSFNNNWSNTPRMTGDNYDASDKSMKYPVRKEMSNYAYLYPEFINKIFYDKTALKDSDGLMTQADKIVDILESKGISIQGMGSDDIVKAVMINVLDCPDVKNFGIVSTSKIVEKTENKKAKDTKGISLNFGIKGPVQITQGVNAFEGTNEFTHQILSPYVNSNKEQNKMTSSGTQTFLDEAHFLFGFTVNPQVFNVQMTEHKTDLFYDELTYRLFKMGMLRGVTNNQSAMKAGCENEIAIFVEMKKDVNAVIANMNRYIKVSKKEIGSIFDLTELFEKINSMDDFIEKVDIYYNCIDELKGKELLKDISKLNIKEINSNYTLETI